MMRIKAERMKKTIKRIDSGAKLIIATLLIGAFVSCASTKIDKVWSDPSYKEKPIASVMIVGVAKNDKDVAYYEDTLQGEFAKAGILAYSGNLAIPASDMDDEQSKKAHLKRIKEAAVKNKVQAVLITAVISVKEWETVKDTLGRSMNYFYDGLTHASWGPSGPNDMSTTEIRLLTAIFDVEKEQLIWQATYQTNDPVSARSLVKNVSNTLVKQLKKDGVI